RTSAVVVRTFRSAGSGRPEGLYDDCADGPSTRMRSVERSKGSPTKWTTWIGAVACAVCAAASLAAQGAKPYATPKTPWGDPDLQGIWPSTQMVGVPFERPKQFGTRLYLTDEEFAQRQKEAEKQNT